MATLFLVLEFLIGDSGTAAEWNENNKEMVSVVQEDGSTIQEEQVNDPHSQGVCRQIHQPWYRRLLDGGGNNPAVLLGCHNFVHQGKKGKFQRKILALNLIPQDPNFFLNNATARDAL